jgi:hypothetical protein
MTTVTTAEIHNQLREMSERNKKIKQNKNMGSCFSIWEKQIIFNFNVLCHFANHLFSIDIQFPIDLIRFIIYTLLIYNQQDISCPCTQQKCRLKWWKNYPIDYQGLFPFHCGYPRRPVVYVHSLNIKLSTLPIHDCHRIGDFSDFLDKCLLCKRHFCRRCITNRKNVKGYAMNCCICNHCFTSFNQGIIHLFNYVTHPE